MGPFGGAQSSALRSGKQWKKSTELHQQDFGTGSAQFICELAYTAPIMEEIDVGARIL